jgi:hypothetical protein
MQNQIEQTLTATVAAAGFAVHAVAPAPDASKRLMHGTHYLVECDDAIYRYADLSGVNNHLDEETGHWDSCVVGAYLCNNGTLTPLDMLGIESDAVQEIADSEREAASQHNNPYR